MFSRLKVGITVVLSRYLGIAVVPTASAVAVPKLRDERERAQPRSRRKVGRASRGFGTNEMSLSGARRATHQAQRTKFNLSYHYCARRSLKRAASRSSIGSGGRGMGAAPCSVTSGLIPDYGARSGTADSPVPSPDCISRKAWPLLDKKL